MSGGSFDYLFGKANPVHEPGWSNMREQLQVLDAPDVVAVMDLAEAGVALIDSDIRDIFHAVEWWCSGDWGEEDARAKIVRWRVRRMPAGQEVFNAERAGGAWGVSPALWMVYPLKSVYGETIFHERKNLVRRLLEADLEERVKIRGGSERLQWRHHGIGCLQAYVQEGGRYETRVHIWHPLLRLVTPNFGDVHDHRFHAYSTVLSGSLQNEVWYDRRWRIEPPAEGSTWDVYETLHQRADPEALKNPQAPVAKVHGYLPAVLSVAAGSNYFIPARGFHRTLVDSFAVTVMTKFNQRDDVKARILVKEGGTLIPAFENGRALPDMKDYLEQAIEALA